MKRRRNRKHSLSKIPLRTLIISSMYPPETTGGVAIHVQYLARSLRALKTRIRHHVHVLTVRGNKEGQDSHDDSRPPNLIVYKLQGGRSGFDAQGSIPYENAIKFCMNLCNHYKTKPDVIHVHDFVGVHIAALLKAIYDIPTILTIHKTPKEWDHTKIFHEPKDFHLQALNRLNIFDFFVAPSKAYKDQLLNHEIPESKIKVIHHGIPEKYLQSLNDQSIFSKLDVDFKNGTIIFCPVRLDRHKGPDIFVEAAIRVLKIYNDNNLYFIIAGSGDDQYKKRLEGIVQSSEVDASRILVGAPDGLSLTLPQMASLYRKSHICVLPSRREGFGQAILESFLFKKPVIASNVGGIRELIIPEKNGLLFDRDEPDKLAEQIIRLLTEPRLLKNIAENGRRSFLDKYESNIMAKNYFELYRGCRDMSARTKRHKKRPIL